MCLILSLATLPASASSAEENEIADLVRNYLSINASIKYEFGDGDLETGTVSEINTKEVATVQEKLTADSLVSDSSSFSTVMDPNIGSYMAQKAEYIKYTRMQEKLDITNYSATYGVPDITVNGSMATVKIFETIGMRYNGLDEDSAISTNYNISLVKTNDGWKICNIQSDDLFDATHQRETFNCESAIARYNSR